MQRLFVTVILTAFALALVGATAFQSDSAQRAFARYEKALADARQAYHTDIHDATEDYRTALQRTLKDAAKALQLDEANRLKVELDALDRRAAAAAALLDTLPPLAPTGGDTAAPSHAALYNGHRYLLLRVPTTWHQAQAVCQELGGHLVTITDAQEQAFVAHLAHEQPAWIGATDANHEGEWRWVTGEPFVYAGWIPGQPDNAGAREHHAHLFPNGTWNDAHPTERLVNAFICEWE